MTARVALALLVVCLTACTTASPPVVTGLQGLADTRYHPLTSSATGHDYHVHVRLPPDYDADPDRRYPAVYLLDGGAMFPKLAGYYHYLRLGEELPDLVIVGISYGTDRFAEGNFRASDFTAPAPDRDYWGDAPRFQQFLADELLPDLEARYRLRADCRYLFGQSLGGQFVLFSALDRPGLFNGRIASNPALHRNVDWFLSRDVASGSPGARLYVGVAEHDFAQFRVPAERLLADWSAREELPWLLRTDMLPGDSHFSAAPAAFRNGMKWFLEAAPCNSS